MLLALGAAQNINIPTREIAPGVHMPIVSIGTWISSGGEDPYTITSNWLKAGGRGIDTALIYHDQPKVKQAITDAGLVREDVFITSKIPTCALDPFLTKKAVHTDLSALGTDYIDLMLIHSPLGPTGSCEATWGILSEFVLNGTIKAIGVYSPRHEPGSTRCI